MKKQSRITAVIVAGWIVGGGWYLPQVWADTLWTNVPAGTAWEDDANLRAFLLYTNGLNAIHTHDGQGMLFCNWYFESAGKLPRDALGLSGATPVIWGGAADLAGQYYLERFAIAMADRDPCDIWDGGAGYVVGQPGYLNEFTAEYCNLPAVNFEPLPDARDPVAVWTRKYTDGFYFYTVNRMPYPLKIRLAVKGTRSVTSVSSGKVTKLSGGILNLDLQPYQLRGFKATSGTRITRCDTDVPVEERERLGLTIKDAEEIARQVEDGKYGEAVKGKLARFRERLEASKLEFREGHVWRTRCDLEHPRMIEVYEICKRFPVGLWERKGGN